jgi:hypothetical protein
MTGEILTVPEVAAKLRCSKAHSTTSSPERWRAKLTTVRAARERARCASSYLLDDLLGFLG